MRRDAFGDLRARLDVCDLAAAEGLTCKGRHFDCPACAGKLKAMSRDGAGWFCVACGAKGDAVGLLAAVRRLDLADARRVALRLAGIDTRSDLPPLPAPPRRPVAVPVVLDPDDAAERVRALRLAALHYSNLGGWLADGTNDGVGPAEHVRYLADFCDLDPADAARLDLAAMRVRGYAAGRIRALGDKVGLAVGELIGACPTRRTGLAGYLRHLGNAALVDAAHRAGLILADGREAMGGRLVFAWTDARGSVVYLTGRAVDGLVADGAHKVHALPVHGAGNDEAIGVPRPRVPFALHAALGIADRDPSRPIIVAEGESDALWLLSRGWPAVATGGTSRTPARDLAPHLAGRVVRVVFDFGDDDAKQAQTDARAATLAADLRVLGIEADAIPSAVMRAALAALEVAA